MRYYWMIRKVLLPIAILTGVLIMTMAIMPKKAVVSYVLAKMDIRQLSREADIIVIGEIEKSLAPKKIAIGEDESIFTDYKISIEKYIKSDAADSELIVRVQGGTIGSQEVFVENEAKLRSGEKVLLFLKRLEGNLWTVLGAGQGKYALEQGKAMNDYGLSVSRDKIIDQIRQSLEGS